MNRKDLVAAFAKRGFSEHLFAGTSGNLSVFDPETKRMYITASGIRYEEMTAEDIMVTDLDGTILEGKHKPSSEWRMHAAVYRAYPQTGAVVHTHSPYATGFSFSNKRILKVSVIVRREIDNIHLNARGFKQLSSLRRNVG